MYGWRNIDKEPIHKVPIVKNSKGLVDLSATHKKLTKSCLHGC